MLLQPRFEVDRLVKSGSGRGLHIHYQLSSKAIRPEVLVSISIFYIRPAQQQTMLITYACVPINGRIIEKKVSNLGKRFRVFTLKRR